MFYIQSTKIFQPNKFPDDCQPGKFDASLKLMQNLKLKRDQNINITQIFKQEDMIMTQETTLETLPSSCYAQIGTILQSDGSSDISSE